LFPLPHIQSTSHHLAFTTSHPRSSLPLAFLYQNDKRAQSTNLRSRKFCPHHNKCTASHQNACFLLLLLFFFFLFFFFSLMGFRDENYNYRHIMINSFVNQTVTVTT
jgi:hypothetical protein